MLPCRKRLVAAAAAAMLSLPLLTQSGAAAEPTREPSSTHVISYDRYSLSIDGRRVWLWSAEFHYYRLPSPDLWRDELEKLKAVGFNAVSLYFSWAYHSPAPGVYDFTGVRDLDRLLDIAAEVGLYVLARARPIPQRGA